MASGFCWLIPPAIFPDTVCSNTATDQTTQKNFRSHDPYHSYSLWIPYWKAWGGSFSSSSSSLCAKSISQQIFMSFISNASWIPCVEFCWISCGEPSFFLLQAKKHHMQSLFADLYQKMFCQIPTGNFNFQGWNLPCPAMSYYWAAGLCIGWSTRSCCS